MKILKTIFILLLLVVGAVNCTPTSNEPPVNDQSATPVNPTIDPNQPVSSDDPTATPVPQPDMNNTLIGRAYVDKVDILVMESFPVQINAHVIGNLPDGCTSVGNITTTYEENVFTIVIETNRPADRMCTEALVPFEQTVPLDVNGLLAGTYTVDVNGVTTTFTLDIDNVLPDSTD